MFRGPRPSGQPRTLRSIAEDKGAQPANFLDGNVTASGLPVDYPTAQQVYVDTVGAAVTPSAPLPPGPTPFANLRKA
jgi:hypothetical protein